jgi:deferrochelatase/peroxidase EfeB
MAAHIRKTNPRNDLGSRGPNGVVNRFRILRRGIPYVSFKFSHATICAIETFRMRLCQQGGR